MVTSATEIGNLALDLLSAGTVTNIVNPTSATESLLNRWYDVIRKQVLREHSWHFATKRQILAASATVPAFGYTKQFPVPADFVRLLTLETSDGVMIPPAEYSLERKNILSSTDESSLRLRYIYNVTDVSLFDDLFVTYLSMKLALAVAYKVSQSNTNVQRIAELQKEMEQLSKAINGQEKPPIKVERSSSLSARRNAGTTLSHRIVF